MNCLNKKTVFVALSVALTLFASQSFSKPISSLSSALDTFFSRSPEASSVSPHAEKAVSLSGSLANLLNYFGGHTTAKDRHAPEGDAHPDLAYDTEQKRYLKVWEEFQPGFSNVYGQFLDKEGNAVGDKVLLSTPRTSCFDHFSDSFQAITEPAVDHCQQNRRPSVAYNKGRFLVVWELLGQADVAKNRDTNGNLTDNPSGKNFSSILGIVLDASTLVPAEGWEGGRMISPLRIATNQPGVCADDKKCPAQEDDIQAWSKAISPDVAPDLSTEGFVVVWGTNRDYITCADPNRRGSSSIYSRTIDVGYASSVSPAPQSLVYGDPSISGNTCSSLEKVWYASNPRIAYNSAQSKFAVVYQMERANFPINNHIGAKWVSVSGADITVDQPTAPTYVAATVGWNYFRNPDVASFHDQFLVTYNDGDAFSDWGKIYAEAMPSTLEQFPDACALNSPYICQGSAQKTPLPVKKEWIQAHQPRLVGNVGISGDCGAACPTSADERIALTYVEGVSGQGDNMTAVLLDKNLAIKTSPVVLQGAPSQNGSGQIASDHQDFYLLWEGKNASDQEQIYGAKIQVSGAVVVCGNTVLEGTEECDDGNTITEGCLYGEMSCTVCDSSCHSQAGATSFCGDNAIDGANGEICDDGNTMDGDGCSATCGKENSAPTVPVLSPDPADGDTWAPTRLYLSWDPSTDVDVGDIITYKLYFSQGAVASLYRSGIVNTHFIIQASTDGRNEYLPDGCVDQPSCATAIYLKANMSYAWKVCAIDNHGAESCSATRTFNTDDSVVGWWRFDDDPNQFNDCPGGGPDPTSTICDYSGKKNAGKPMGGVTWLPPPDPMLLGGALQFDGVDDYVEVADAAMLKYPQLNDFSIFNKFKTADLGGTYGMYFINKGDGINGWADYEFGNLNGVFLAHLRGKIVFGTTLIADSLSHSAMVTYKECTQVDKSLCASILTEGEVHIYLDKNEEAVTTLQYPNGWKITGQDSSLFIGARTYQGNVAINSGISFMDETIVLSRSAPSDEAKNFNSSN